MTDTTSPANHIATTNAFGLDMSDEARALRIGKHVLEFARKSGWKDDGEGAFEFIQRHSYVVGFEDAGGKVQYGTDTKGSRWPISALVELQHPNLNHDYREVRCQLAYIGAYNPAELSSYSKDRLESLAREMINRARLTLDETRTLGQLNNNAASEK